MLVGQYQARPSALAYCGLDGYARNAIAHDLWHEQNDGWFGGRDGHQDMNYLAVGLNCAKSVHIRSVAESMNCSRHLESRHFSACKGWQLLAGALSFKLLFRQRCSLDFAWPPRWLYFSCFGSRDPDGVQIGGWTSFFYIPDPEALIAEVLMDAWIRGFPDPQLGGRLAGLACSKDSFSFGAISHLRTWGY